MVALLAVRPPKHVTADEVRAWRLSRVDIRTGAPLTQRDAAIYYRISERQWRRYEAGETDIPGWMALLVLDNQVPKGFRRDT